MPHHRDLSIAEAPSQRTNDAELSSDRRSHMRDAVGDYTAHSRLEVTRNGREILDLATEIQLALVDCMEGQTSTEWSARTGFRSSGDVRKLKAAELMGTVTDIATLRAVDPARFSKFARLIAEMAGWRCEPTTAPATAILDAVAHLGTSSAEVSGRILHALSPASPGGASITAEEADAARAHLDEHKAAIAEIEKNLGGLK